MMKRLLQSTALMAALAVPLSIQASADVYIIGSNVNGTSWGLAAPDAKMTETSEGVYEWDGETLGTGFKFNDGTWDGNTFAGTDIMANLGSNGTVLTLGEPYSVYASGASSNIIFDDDLVQIAAPHVILNLNDLTLTVTGRGEEVELAYHLVGTFNEWDLENPDYVFTKQNDGSYLLENVSISWDASFGACELIIASDNWTETYGAPVLEDGTFSDIQPDEIYPLVKGGVNIPILRNGIYNVVFTSGDNASVVFFLIGGGDVVIEKGTRENPWTVDELLAQSIDNPITGAWTEAYIVGWVDGMNYAEGCYFEFNGNVAASNTNVLIAADVNERDYNYCMPVQLLKGSVRDALNLQAHPENLGAKVLLYGNYEKYFGVPGLKSISDYEITAGPIEVEKTYHFVGTVNAWDIENPEYAFVQQENGTYLLENLALTQDESQSELPTFKITSDGWEENYGSPTTAMYPFLLEENLLYNLEKDGSNIPYNCDGIYNVVFTPGETPTVIFNRVSEEPGKGTSENPWTVTELLAKDPDTEAITTGTWTTGYIVGWVNGKTYDTGVQFEFAEGVEVSTTNIIIAASKDERDYTKCMPVQLPSGEVRDALNLSANPDNLGREIKLFGNFEKYFGVNGLKSVSEYEIIHNPMEDILNARKEALANYTGDFYVIGDSNSWVSDDEAYKMTLKETGVYEWSGSLKGQFAFCDGTTDGGVIEGSDVPRLIGRPDGNSVNFNEWISLNYDIAGYNFGLAGEQTYKVNITLDLINARVFFTREYEPDYSEFVFAISQAIDETTEKLSFTPYAMEGGPTDYTVTGVKCEGVHYFMLSDLQMEDLFISFLNEEGMPETQITDDNLLGQLHYTHMDIIEQEDQPTNYGILSLNGVYDVNVSFDGKVANLTFVENKQMNDRIQALTDYTGDVYLIGEINGDKLADDNYRLERTDIGLYEWEGVLKGQFKFNNGTWDEGVIPGSDVPLTICATSPASLTFGYYTPIDYSQMYYGFHFDDLEAEYRVHIYLDLLNGRIGVVAVEEPEPDPENVWLMSQVENGPAFGFMAKNHEQHEVILMLDENYWTIDTVEVNGQVFEVGDPGVAFNCQVDGQTNLLFHVSYKGELVFVSETTGVVELENAAKIYVADGKVNIENLNVGDEIVVYNTGGQIISRYVAQSTSLSISLDRGQVYVVRAGTAAAKVML